MPTEGDALYSRGRYRLEWDRRRDGTLRSPFLQIVWYDADSRRNRSRSTGATEIAAAEDALDRFYFARQRGQAVCGECGRPFDGPRGFTVREAVADYLLAREDRPSIGSIRPRLAHLLDFQEATGRNGLTCDNVDAELIEEFRAWSGAQPVRAGQTVRDRALGTTEATVRTLAAAINLAHKRKETLHPAGFTALAPSAVSRTPTYRSTVEGLAAMFRYCLRPQPPAAAVWSIKMIHRQIEHRRSLLRFLQASVATWARPDTVYDISTAPERGQWFSEARVLRLNPIGRRQTKKHRPEIPVPEKFAALLDVTAGYFVPVKSVRKAFEAMLAELGLPRERETGVKLIRRSMATLARDRLGEERWRQGEIMLGHHRASVSDVYALPKPENLGRALDVTASLIDEIEALCSGAFTGEAPELHLVKGVASA